MNTKARTRGQRVALWTVYHVLEIGGVVVPMVLAAMFTHWFALVSAIVAAVWAVIEIRVARRAAALRATRVPGQITTGDRDPSTGDRTTEVGA
jgi:hypothetical protein